MMQSSAYELYFRKCEKMNDILFSEEFKKFWSCINDDYDDMKIFLSRLQKAMPYVAENLCIGRFTVVFSYPNIYTKSASTISSEIYSSLDGYIDMPITKKYTTVDKGTFTLQIFPSTGEIWTDSVKEQLLYFMDIIYKLGSRAHITDTYAKSVYIDSQTGVYNSAGLTKFATNLSIKGEFYKYTSIFLNIKNFRYVNKSYGFRVGDKLLVSFAHNISNFIGEQGIVAHLGGDNFFALVHDSLIDAFVKHISSLTITLDYSSGQKAFEILTCAGLYSIENTSTVGDMMNNSNIAYKAAKKSINTNIMWFTKEMLMETMHKKEILGIFPKALENEEFLIYYQPKVNMEDGSIYGAEALVRWFKQNQIMPPMDFIPVLEEEGTICKLDFYVFEKVCQDIKAWLNKGIEPVRISTNFSRINIQDDNFSNKILETIKQYDIDTKYIEIEITEMSSYNNEDKLIKFLSDMKKNNIYVSIDDFGSGYSSLNILKDLNVDMIKLDRTFISVSVEKANNQDAIVKNVVSLITELGMEVIAEGVETETQKNFLTSINCKLAQGFLFDKPLPHDEFEEKLRNNLKY